MRMRSIVVGAAALMAATAAAVVPTVTASASAHTASGTNVVVNTKSYGHMDTTSESGSATFQEPSGGGPVWAIDSLNERWTVAAYATPPADGAQYSVTLRVTGGSKFSEFADPGQAGCPGDSDGTHGGGPKTGQGGVTGTLQYDVTSTNAPSTAGVPAVQAANTSLGTVLGQIFNGGQNIVGGGHYTFTYSNVCGTPYVQTG